MNRLTDAMRRAGNGAIELPASSATATCEEIFPAEQPTLAPEPMPAPSRGDDTLMRVAQPAAGAHVQEPPRAAWPDAPPDARDETIEPVRTAAGRVKSALSVFSGFNKTLVDRMVVPEGAPPAMTEEYRRLAAALHQAQVAHGTKVLMVTSASPGEGKTLTASNLALTLSQSYERQVLLIDADLRKPSVHTLFDLDNS